MSNENNVVNLNRIKNLTRDDVIDHLERCQMAAEVTLPVANMEALLTQLLGYMDNSKPELQQKITESDRYGRQADITIENLERKVDQLAAENAGLKSAIPPLKNINDATDSWDDVSLAEEVGFNYAVSTILKSIPETPATSAFLAEVRASGVEQLASLAGNEYQRYKSVGDRAGMRKWKSIVILCTDFAAQLRQGGEE